MIRLHQFKRQWGIANPSPFCMKVETYLRMTGLAYDVIEEASPLNGPKKKLPYIDDGEKVIPDSGFIIDYLKASYGNPLDGGLSRAQQAEAHLMRRLCEESLLWPVVYSRWIDAGGWSVIKPAFFGVLPPVLREAVPWLAQRRVKRMLWLQGMGRHRPEEIYRLGIEDLAALAACLGDKPFLLGAAPASIDAAAYATLRVRRSTMNIRRIGLDLAKNVFSVCGVDEHGKVVVRKTLRRDQVLGWFAQLPSALVGMEACSGAHYWARELIKLGHDARIMDSRLVAPYRHSGRVGKNDRNDAEAICEAVGRPNMRFVSVKSAESQAVLTVHRVRESVLAERTGVANQMRGLLMEFGIVIPKGLRGLRELRRTWGEALKRHAERLPSLGVEEFRALFARLLELDARITEYDRKIARLARASNAKLFKNGRQFAAWLGLTPRQYSMGGPDQ